MNFLMVSDTYFLNLDLVVAFRVHVEGAKIDGPYPNVTAVLVGSESTIFCDKEAEVVISFLDQFKGCGK